MLESKLATKLLLISPVILDGFNDRRRFWLANEEVVEILAVSASIFSSVESYSSSLPLAVRSILFPSMWQAVLFGVVVGGEGTSVAEMPILLRGNSDDFSNADDNNNASCSHEVGFTSETVMADDLRRR